MPDETDWLMKPLLRGGMCSYSDYLDGTLDLVDIGRMNDAIAVWNENARRLNDANK